MNATAEPKTGPLATNRFVVVKVGGRALDDGDLADRVAGLVDDGYRPVLVHGGGAQLSAALEEAGIETPFEEGLRVTTGPVLDVATRVFAGLGKQLAGRVSQAGVPAVALDGHDGRLLEATPREGLGRVGRMEAVDAGLLRFLAFNGIVPVVGPPAVGPDGGGLNVNADEIASAIARSLSADRLVFLTDVPGVVGPSGDVVAEIPSGKARDLESADDGMGPKLKAAAEAAAGGVGRVHITQAGVDLAGLVAGVEAGTTVTDGIP